MFRPSFISEDFGEINKVVKLKTAANINCPIEKVTCGEMDALVG